MLRIASCRWPLLFGASLVMAIAQADTAPTVDQRVKALEDYVNGNSKGTIDRATVAIAKDPKNYEEYLTRGMARQEKGDLDGAIADFTQMIALDPKRPEGYSRRGETRRMKHDFDGTIADFTQLMALTPDDPIPCYSRAEAKQAMHDWDGAIADYDQALKIKPKDGAPAYSQNLILCNRAFAREFKGDFDGAISDFNQLIQIENDSTYTHFYLWIARCKNHQKADADKELTAYLASLPPPPSTDSKDKSVPAGLADSRAWEAEVGRFLLGQLDEASFIKAGGASTSFLGNSRVGEAWYYVGVKHLLAGDTKTAADDFRKVPATEFKDSPSCLLAESELAVMQK